MIPKPHKSYEEQLELLEGRGMLVDNTSAALNLLKHASYYTLSGYWYPFRERLPDGSRGDNFRSGTKLTDVAAYWDFDNKLRGVTLVALQPIEIYLRALLSHELGAIDPLIHEKPIYFRLTKVLTINDGLPSSVGRYERREKNIFATIETLVMESFQYGWQLEYSTGVVSVTFSVFLRLPSATEWRRLSVSAQLNSNPG